LEIPAANYTLISVLRMAKKLFYLCILQFQGPPGKDGLPGHPGQRGETVSK